jgi:hypothetical protein
MVHHGFLLFAVSIFAIPSALAADCFTNESNLGFEPSDLQQAADQVCNNGPNTPVRLPKFSTGYQMAVTASYIGPDSDKIHCEVRNAISESLREGVFNVKSSKF